MSWDPSDCETFMRSRKAFVGKQMHLSRFVVTDEVLLVCFVNAFQNDLPGSPYTC